MARATHGGHCTRMKRGQLMGAMGCRVGTCTHAHQGESLPACDWDTCTILDIDVCL